MNEVFRIRKYYRNVALSGLAFFVVMAALSVVVANDVPKERRLFAVIFFLSIWGFFAGLTIWILVAYWRESLVIRNGQIEQQGVLFQKCLDESEISEVCWKRAPSGGRVKLRSRSVVMKIDLGNFEPDQRLKLIRYFRDMLDVSLQRDWPRFCHAIAVPISRHGTETLEEGEVLLTRRRWDWMLIPVVLLSAAIGIGTWLMLNEPRFLVAPALPTMLWAFLRYSTPTKGMPGRRISATPGHVGFLVFELVWIIVGIGCFAIFQRLKAGMPNPAIIATVLLLGWFIGLLCGAHRADKFRQKHSSSEVEQSVAIWEELSY